MRKNTYINNLPECTLIEEFIKKFEKRFNNGIEFDYLGILNDLKGKISQEVRYIDNLFPEYTPHDEQYHLNNLFRIADIVLGKKLIEKMNLSELFLLICCLYGHDWGMAISEEQKREILKGIDSKEEFVSDIITQNDIERLKQFIKNQSPQNEIKDASMHINIERWREYVRKNHHIRSGELIKKHLEIKNTGIAEAAKRICEGHGLEFSDIRNLSIYPSNFTVLNETVNLRALTIYVRLIDLLDITQERTPYVIWKFVYPRDTFSQMEWEKHRALYTVAEASYHSGRIIKIDGKAVDNNVYVALKDLQCWCDEQFRGCCDLLAEINDKYHKLDIYHIEWNINTEGFKPIDIRFEFDRKRMIEILGEQIYGNDPYVFLRELVQNSIDAIKMRQVYLKDNGFGNTRFGKIQIKIDKDDEQNMIVTLKDNGIGMNEYIVKNYLAIAGKTYYSSSDFKNLGINIDPISKFGIGILSCNAVADKIEIESCRDPYLEKNITLLKINIDSFTNHFKIQEIEGDIKDVGTKIKVFIDKEKIKKCGYDIEEYDIVTYLSYVAAFSEIPIHIEDGEKKYVILHPYIEKDSLKKMYSEDIEIRQLDLSYNWNETIIPSNTNKAKNLLNQHINNIQLDLDMEGVEGNITYLIPKEQYIDIVGTYREYTLIPKAKLDKEVEIVFEKNRSDRNKSINLCPSCRIDLDNMLYNNGILVPNSPFNKFSNRYFSDGQVFFRPRIIINIKNKDEVDINISRTESDGIKKVYNKLIRKWESYIIKEHMYPYNNSSPYEKLKAIGKLIGYFGLNLEHIPEEYYYLLFIDKNGYISVKSIYDVKELELYTTDLNEEYMTENGNIDDDLTNNFKLWQGNEFVLSSSDFESLTVKGIIRFQDFILENFYIKESLQIINGKDTENELIMEFKLKPKNNSKIDEDKLLIKAIEGLDDLTTDELSKINSIIYSYGFGTEGLSVNSIGEFIKFSSPFDKSLLGYENFINILHPIGIKLLRFICKIIKIDKENQFTKDNIRELNHLFGSFNEYGNIEHKLLKFMLISDFIKSLKVIDFNIEDETYKILNIKNRNSKYNKGYGIPIESADELVMSFVEFNLNT